MTTCRNCNNFFPKMMLSVISVGILILGCSSSGGSGGGALGTRGPPEVQIRSNSCSFWENLADSYVGAPPGELAPPPWGNPGCATGIYEKSLFLYIFNFSRKTVILLMGIYWFIITHISKEVRVTWGYYS